VALAQERAAVAARAEVARAVLEGGLFPSQVAADLAELDRLPPGDPRAALLRFRVAKKRLLAEMA
jgi:hypothetical protein